MINCRYKPHSIELFTAHNNRLLNHFVLWRLDRSAIAVDAFSFELKGVNPHCFPLCGGASIGIADPPVHSLRLGDGGDEEDLCLITHRPKVLGISLDNTERPLKWLIYARVALLFVSTSTNVLWKCLRLVLTVN